MCVASYRAVVGAANSAVMHAETLERVKGARRIDTLKGPRSPTWWDAYKPLVVPLAWGLTIAAVIIAVWKIVSLL